MNRMLPGVWNIVDIRKIVVNVRVIIHHSLTASQLHTKYKTMNTNITSTFDLKLGIQCMFVDFVKRSKK